MSKFASPLLSLCCLACFLIQFHGRIRNANGGDRQSREQMEELLRAEVETGVLIMLPQWKCTLLSPPILPLY